MNSESKKYERAGDGLQGNDAVRAYRAAQNHLQPDMGMFGQGGYLDEVKRLQGKIIKALEGGDGA